MKRNNDDLEIIRLKDLLLYGLIFFVTSRKRFEVFIFRYFLYGVLFGIFVDIVAYLLCKRINKYFNNRKKGE